MSYSARPFLCDSAHLVSWLQDPSVLFQGAGSPSFSGPNIPWCVYATASFSIHPLTDTGCFCIFATVSNASVAIGVQLSLQDTDFIFFGSVHRGGITGS